ncbi:MAG: dienelactone hydrolase family protein [Erythrobacter sp.]
MCDRENLESWANARLSRRQLGGLTGAAVLAVGASRSGALHAQEALAERAVSFTTPDGTADGFFVHPAGGKHPAVILWPDIAGLREAKRAIARELAAQGYAVLVMNPYYRDVAGEQFADFAGFVADGGFQKVGPWRGKLDAGAIGRDTHSAIMWLEDQDAVDLARFVGAQGYCMGGPFAIWSAAAVPSRIKAAASFHGGGLVSESSDAPVAQFKWLAKNAGVLVAVAQNDDAKAPDHRGILAARAEELGLAANIKLFGADHGWMVADSPAYSPDHAREGEADLLALYRAHL